MHRRNLIVRIKKSRTTSSERSEFSSLNTGLKGKLGPGKLGQFGPRSPSCQCFRPGPSISLNFLGVIPALEVSVNLTL